MDIKFKRKEYETMDKKVMKRVKEHYDEVIKLGYEVVLVALQGSQNYKLDIEGSDVDTKAIVLPKFEDIVLNRHPVSCTHVMDDGAHVDIKDIRLMFNEFKKANINFVELLFTEYVVINEKYTTTLLPVFTNREKIARYKPLAALKCATGTAIGEYKDLEKNFNGKTVSTILRLELFMENYIDEKQYKDCIIPSNILDTLKAIKSGNHNITKETLLMSSKHAVEHCKLLLEAYEKFYKPEVNKDIDILLNDVVAEILADWLHKDIDNFKKILN